MGSEVRLTFRPDTKPRPALNRPISKPRPARLRSAGYPVAILAVSGLLATGMAAQYRRLLARDAALSSEVQGLAAQWQAVAGQLAAVNAVLPRLNIAHTEALRVSAEFESAKWSPVLRSIAASSGTGIDLHTIHVEEMPGDAPTCSLRIEGGAMGTESRITADRFLQSMRHGLEKDYEFVAPLHFEQLADARPAPEREDGEEGVNFTITARLAPAVTHHDVAPPSG